MFTIFRNKNTFPQACFLILFFFIWPYVFSCSENLTKPEDKNYVHKENTSTPIRIGELHNECVIGYITSIGEKYPHKVPVDVARQAVIHVVNDIAAASGIRERVTAAMFDEIMARMQELREEGIVDFSTPENIDLERVLISSVSFGVITQNEADKHLLAFRNFEKTIENNGKIVNTICAIDVDSEDPTVDVLYSSSAIWWVEMERYIAGHPELQGWWDYWKNKMQTIGLLFADFIGAMMFSEGGALWMLVGSLFASVAFTVAFIE